MNYCQLLSITVVRTQITRTYVELAGGPSRTVRLSGHVDACLGMSILLNIDETLAGHVHQGQYLVEWVDSLISKTEVGISEPGA